jgi:hypothetical protein
MIFAIVQFFKGLFRVGVNMGLNGGFIEEWKRLEVADKTGPFCESVH